MTPPLEAALRAIEPAGPPALANDNCPEGWHLEGRRLEPTLWELIVDAWTPWSWRRLGQDLGEAAAGLAILAVAVLGCVAFGG